MLIPPRVVAILTVVIALTFLASGWSEAGPPDHDRAWYLVLLVANTLPVLAVRRQPLVALAILAVAYPLWVAAGFGTATLQSLPTLIGMFAAGAWTRPLWQRTMALGVPVWMMSAAAAGLWDVGLVELGYVAVVLVVVWTLGVVVAERQTYAKQLETTTRQLHDARAELAEQAVTLERARIARELHDVIGHAMSVITVQAAVGAHLAAGVDQNEGSTQATQALAIIEQTGRRALNEMRRMLKVLRGPAGGADRPDTQAGLADLTTLIAQTRSAGVAASVIIQGPARDLSPGLDLAAYRIVQEALTNVVKHSPGSPAEVSITYQPDEVGIEVTNRSTHLPAQITPGQGLRGMAERVALYDGSLTVAVDGDTLRVSVRFPTGDDE